MPDQPPRATVIIPVYNSAGTRLRAVRSVQQQSLLDIELIMIDDAYPDQSRSLAHEFAEGDSRIRIISLPHNMGKSHAMNRTIAVATGTIGMIPRHRNAVSPIAAAFDRISLQDRLALLDKERQVALVYPRPKPMALAHMVGRDRHFHRYIAERSGLATPNRRRCA